ncbi:UNVERIFIED_ORG: hypothetical protein GGD51_000690 [Rhizobium esperanzae]
MRFGCDGGACRGVLFPSLPTVIPFLKNSITRSGARRTTFLRRRSRDPEEGCFFRCSDSRTGHAGAKTCAAYGEKNYFLLLSVPALATGDPSCAVELRASARVRNQCWFRYSARKRTRAITTRVGRRAAFNCLYSPIPSRPGIFLSIIATSGRCRLMASCATGVGTCRHNSHVGHISRSRSASPRKDKRMIVRDKLQSLLLCRDHLTANSRMTSNPSADDEKLHGGTDFLRTGPGDPICSG